MGMACDAEAAPAAAVAGPGAPAPAGAAFLNTEETAMILTSLSRCQFGANGAVGGAAAAKKKARSYSSGDSDGERHSDLEGSSDDEDPNGRRSAAGGGLGRVHRVQQINFDGPVGSKLDFTDEAGFSHRFRNESNRVKSMVTKHISIDELREHFDRPIIDVAKDFGICITLMKKICRRNGIKRWPHRQIRSLSKSIASMEAAMLSAHGSERDKYRDQIHNLKLKRESVIADPNKDNGIMPSGTPSSSSGGSSGGLRPKVLLPRDSAGSMGAPPPPHRAYNSTTGAPAASTSLRPHHHVSTKSSWTAGAAGGATKSEPSSSTSGTVTTPTSGGSKGGRWTSEEHAAFLEGIRLYGKDWRRVAQVVVTRSAVQTRTHAQKYLLKFAGRFPFETAEGVLSSGSSGSQLRRAARPPTSTSASPLAAAVDVSMLSPTPTAMTTPASDDCVSNASWNSDEPPVRPLPAPVAKPARSEAMALILNDSPALGPQAEPAVSSFAAAP